jgi:UDP-glucose 4-epimerase
MKVLVSGCAGLLGSNFCKYILEKYDNIKVIGNDNMSGGLKSNLNYLINNKNFIFIEGDLTEHKVQYTIEHTIKLVGGIDYIWHFAAYAAEGLSPFIRQFNYTNNIIPTAFLINVGIKYSIKRFIFTSSMAVYGENIPPFDESYTPKPVDPYGIAKYACEMDLQVACEHHNLPYCIIRPHNVYGPLQNIFDPYRNVIGIWMLKSMSNKPITVYGDGEQTRAFSYIDDILPCLLNAAIYTKAKNQIINLGGIKEISLNDLAQIVSEITGNKHIIHLEPRNEVKHAWSTHQKSIDLLDYKEQIDLIQGIKKMWEWARIQPIEEQKFMNYEIDNKLYTYWNINKEFN